MILVFQSYRTEDVPAWIRTCLDSVKKWAIASSYDYRFIDDSLFTYAPDWYREKVGHNIQLVSDLARLVLARKFLDAGYDRVVWIDADMLIFDPDSFLLETPGAFSFCRETWLDEDPDRQIIHQENVNNSISMFSRDNSFLDFYIDVCLRIVSSRNDFEPVTVGTEFLTGLNGLCPLPLMKHVGIISPAIVYGLLHHQEQFQEEYLLRHGNPVYAANLCGSKCGEYFRDMQVTGERIGEVVNHLLKCRRLIKEDSSYALK